MIPFDKGGLDYDSFYQGILLTDPPGWVIRKQSFEESLSIKFKPQFPKPTAHSYLRSGSPLSTRSSTRRLRSFWTTSL